MMVCSRTYHGDSFSSCQCGVTVLLSAKVPRFYNHRSEKSWLFTGLRRELRIGCQKPREGVAAPIVFCGRADPDTYRAGRTSVRLDRSSRPGCGRALEIGC